MKNEKKVTVKGNANQTELEVSTEDTIKSIVARACEALSLPTENIIIKVDNVNVNQEKYTLTGKEQIIEIRSAEIIYGPNTIDVSTFVGKSIEAAITANKHALNIPKDVKKIFVEVAGKKAKLSHVIVQGNVVEITKTKGSKL